MLVQHFNIMGNQYVDENGHITIRVISKDASKNKIDYLKRRPVADEDIFFVVGECKKADGWSVIQTHSDVTSDMRP